MYYYLIQDDGLNITKPVFKKMLTRLKVPQNYINYKTIKHTTKGFYLYTSQTELTETEKEKLLTGVLCRRKNPKIVYVFTTIPKGLCKGRVYECIEKNYFPAYQIPKAILDTNENCNK